MNLDGNASGGGLPSTLPSLGHKVISDELFKFCEKIITPINFSLAILGVVTNLINIRVFLEQGIKNSNTNIGLLALSVFDLLGCAVMISSFGCHLLTFTDNLHQFLVCQTYTFYVSLYYMIFVYCSYWTTVYISLERTLCVVIPLKVKLILRPKTTVFIILGIFLFFVGFRMIYISPIRIVWKLHPYLNQTIPVLYEPEFSANFIYTATFVTTILTPTSMFIVAVNTIIMFYKLNQFKKWRNKNMNSSSKDTDSSAVEKDASKQEKPMSSKDVDLLKSVTTVTCIFLACLSVSYIPVPVIFMTPGVSFSGINRNLMILTYSVSFGFGMINASSNFFFYLRISTRYKEAFSAVFPVCSRAASNA